MAGHWTDFRGPGRLGHYTEKPILSEWPADGLRRLWKQPVGGGYASFVIAGGLAYTIEQRRDQSHAGDPIKRRMMDFQVQGNLTTGQSFDDRQLPQRVLTIK